jgi:hypothetical protein
MPDRRGAYLLAVHGRDRYERDLETIRRDEELAARAAKLSAELVEIVPRLVRGRDAGKKLVPHMEKVARWIQGIAEREHYLVHEPWRSEADVGPEETELEAEPAPLATATERTLEKPGDNGRDAALKASQPIELALTVPPAAYVAEREDAPESTVRRLLVQVGDDAPAWTVARAHAAAAQVPAGALLRLLANGPWNTKPREWEELTSAERADYLAGCLEQLRDEAGTASEICTRTVRAADNDPANGRLPETPADSQSAGSATLAPP